ncbi:hypothetical protein [Zoogloea sp.]|uniref:hypothetical protein n=1 Tax=Zoogloea sp. TaxID=49181 RepID=UPI0035B2F3F6
MTTFQEIPEDSDFIQGDLIENITQNPNEKIIGMILNADCDIAQKRWGSNFSWISIIPAIDYLNEIWSAEQCRSLWNEKRVKNFLSDTNSFLHKKNPEFSEIDIAALLEWFRSYTTTTEFFSAIGKTPSQSEELDADFIRLAFNIQCSGMSPGDRIRKIWEITHKKPCEINKKLQNALIKTDGFPDFFFLPTMPNKDSNGFVALLRTINSSPHNRLFKTEVDARINTVSDQPAFFRFGRLTDAVRYQVVQKLTFLFSRIGSHPKFEDACNTSAALAASAYTKKAA